MAATVIATLHAGTTPVLPQPRAIPAIGNSGSPAIHDRLQISMDAANSRNEQALARFDRSLAESTVTLAAELTQAGGGTGGAADGIAANVHNAGDVDAALHNLGFRAAGLGVGISLDVWALLNSRLAKAVACYFNVDLP